MNIDDLMRQFTEGTKITCNILPWFGVADRGDGGYIIGSRAQ